MNDKLDRDMAKMHQEIATHNSELALSNSEKTRNELLNRMAKIEMQVAMNTQALDQLFNKYNLLLTARFDGRSTAGE
jgi:porphobilinogen deaminase